MEGGMRMADREKVIKGLQSHADGCGYRSHHCDAMECPYRYGDESCDIEEMCRDALALLKEQDAVEPRTKPSGGWLETKTLCFCGACGARISKRKTKYCQECGTAVKWE